MISIDPQKLWYVVRARLDYSAETDVFTWREKPVANQFDNTWNKRFAGKQAGALSNDRYIRVSIDGKLHLCQLLAWLYVHGVLPASGVDHKDRDPSNNRMANLRVATKAENGANTALSRRNTSGAKGVRWNRECRKWQATIVVNGKSKHLGLFDSIDAAKATYMGAAREIYGQFVEVSQ